MSLEHSERPARTPEHHERSALPEPLFTKDGQPVYPAMRVASYVHLYPTRLYDLAAAGRIRAVKPGHDVFVVLEDVEHYIRSPKNKGGRPRKPRL